MKFPRLKYFLAISILFTGCGPDTRIAGTNDRPANMPADPVPAIATASPTGSAQRELDVPYVPTPQTVVDAMLAMAKVTREDVLYDLGSGDGRIPITAAAKFGTRGVGIDLNPVRVKEANEKAVEAGVTDKVRFIEGDIFEADFSEATVVTLYLLPEVNLKLRPAIQNLKPGTRVVSHNYDMGDWAPENSRKITIDGTDHYVYFWRVPEKK
jgi:precorrin-6B methylase 2